MKRKLLAIIAAGLVLILCLTVVIYWGVTGVTSLEEGITNLSQVLKPRENNAYRKASYSVSDEKAVKTADRVVASIADKELTNSVLQVFYWMEVYAYLEDYGYEAVYYGLDYTQSLDQQTCLITGGTWQQFFLEQAMQKWHRYQAMAMKAEAEGIALPEQMQSELDSLRQTMTDTVLELDYSGLDAFIQADMGAGCTFDDYYQYMDIFYRGYSYLEQQLETVDLSDDAVATYFSDHEQELQEQGITRESGNVADVRHILIAVDGGTEDEDGDLIYSDEDWAACYDQAQQLLDEWLAGEATEESFAQLAHDHSEDAGSNENGGLYESLDTGSGFVPEFIDWYTDESRQTGDYDIIRTDYGYHLMYFSGSEAKWLRTCRQELMEQQTQAFLDEVIRLYPMEANYKRIALAAVDFSEKLNQ